MFLLLCTSLLNIVPFLISCYYILQFIILYIIFRKLLICIYLGVFSLSFCVIVLGLVLKFWSTLSLRVSDKDLVSVFYMRIYSFPKSTFRRGSLLTIVCFGCLYQNLMTITVWTYFWTFYFILLVYVSVFVPVTWCFVIMGMLYSFKSNIVIRTAFFFIHIGFAIWSLLCFKMNFRIF
jgi:hypothetical protein